jgi:hypothetical protein
MPNMQSESSAERFAETHASASGDETVHASMHLRSMLLKSMRCRPDGSRSSRIGRSPRWSAYCGSYFCVTGISEGRRQARLYGSRKRKQVAVRPGAAAFGDGRDVRDLEVRRSYILRDCRLGLGSGPTLT